MEQDQQEKYMKALAMAVALVVGPRDQDYNKGGIGLRDYWKVNGIKSPVQMVDMKLKRAFSQLGTWTEDTNGHPLPKDWQQVDKLEESMLDLINYAAFVICEAHSLADDTLLPRSPEVPGSSAVQLVRRMSEAVVLWQAEQVGKGRQVGRDPDFRRYHRR